MRSFSSLVSLASWLSAAGAALAQAPAPAGGAPSVAAYVAPAAIAGVSVSPDGARLALISRAQGRSAIKVLSPSGDREIGAGKLDIHGVDWLDATHIEVRNSTVVEAAAILPRQRVDQGVSYDLASNKAVTLLDGTPGVAAMLTNGWQAHGVYKGRPVVFLRGLSVGPAFALYRVDPTTGRGFALTAPSLDAEAWLVTAGGDIRASRSAHGDGRGSITEVKTARGWRKLDDDGTLTLMGMTQDGARVIVRRDDQYASVSPQDGALTPLPVPAGRAITGLIFGNDSRLLGLRLSGMTPEYQFHQPALALGWPKLVKAFPGAQVNFVNASDDGRSIALIVEGPQDAGALYWANLATNHADKVADLRPDIPAERIGRTTQIELKARDGLSLPSALTLPAQREATNLPLVVLVGATPTSSVTLDFSAAAQAFAAHGYAVLQVNTRGSTLSPALLAAGIGQIGRGMQSDLDDAVADLAKRGVIDAQRVCIAGIGYGGYAALEAVTVAQSRYRCAAAVAPEVDLSDAVRWPDAYTRGPQSRVALWRRMAGADAPGAGRTLDALSPLRAAARADAPILLVADTRNLAESGVARRMRDALQSAHKPNEFVQLDAETGDLATPSGEGATLTAMLDFIERKNPA